MNIHKVSEHVHLYNVDQGKEESIVIGGNMVRRYFCKILTFTIITTA